MFQKLLPEDKFRIGQMFDILKREISHTLNITAAERAKVQTENK